MESAQLVFKANQQNSTPKTPPQNKQKKNYVDNELNFYSFCFMIGEKRKFLTLQIVT